MCGIIKQFLRPFGLAVFSLSLSACGGGSEEDSSSSIAIDGNTPIVYVKRSVSSIGNPTDAFRFTAGGDLYMRQFASASSSETNITGHLTNGQGDVSDPEVSYDGLRVVFSMRLSSGTWNIYEFDTTQPTSASNPSRIISDDATANSGDDVDPNYLADDRIIFSSNRQVGSKAVMTNNNIEPYTYRDEYERERVTVLHVMNADGSNIRQISANQSHDRNPTVRSSGDIMFARWDHVGGRNQFSVFNANPDGTGMFVLYGAHSPGNSFLHPREMENGNIISTLMPLSGTTEGGALMVIRVADCSENGDCKSSGTGQSQATTSIINFGRGISDNGRFTTPYPLWDGTNRVLVSYSISCVKFNSCATQINPVTGAVDTVEGPPQYGIYMLNIDTQQLNPLILAAAGEAYTDPIALMARLRPNIIADKPEIGTTAILNVKSVYDTDNIGRMGNPVLTASETPIPQTAAPTGSSQTQVADIALMKDPANSAYQTRPARFVRITKAVPTPSSVSTRDIGETNFEMQQILGYVEVEPDGSFKIEGPADTPLAITTIDSEGRAFQTHTNWIQARPGELRTCNGCHGARRGFAINAQPIAGTHPNTNWPTGSTPGTGETMAETRTNLDATALQLNTDMVHTDIWADTSITGVTATADLTIDYSGLSTTVPTNGIINYPDHVDPLWTASRTNTTGSDITAGNMTIANNATFSCTTCHDANVIDDVNDPVWQRSAGLDLSSDIGGTGRLVSYNELMIGDPIIDPATGLPMIVINNDALIVVREPSPVNNGLARASRIAEIISNQELNAGTVNGIAQNIGNIDHSWMMNSSEKRVVYEWVDLGGQYYNDPFGSDTNGNGIKDQSELRSQVTRLNQSVFNSTIHPILMNNCATCHQPFAGALASPNNPPNTNFTGNPNRFVLTGQQDGDFNITSTMVTDLAGRSTSSLLAVPSTVTFANHPQDPNNAGQPVLPSGSADYTTIWNWIDAAATANGL